MSRFLALIVSGLLLSVTLPQAAVWAADEKLREQFDEIVEALNDNTFREFQAAINERALINRIFGTRVIDPDVKEAFADGFESSLQEIFVSSFPRARTPAQQGGEVIGTVIAFQFENGQGRAIVRYEGSGYRFSYHSYELTQGRGGRLVIVDWFDYYNASWFSEDAGNALLRAMPGQAAVKALMTMPNPSEGQLFQMGELLKAVRDQNPQRYFQIYDGLDEALRQEPYFVALNFHYCRTLGDAGRINQAVEALVTAFPGDPLYSFSLVEFYIARGLYEEAITQLNRFEEALGMKDGVSESFKATSAMALGDFERAQAFALTATEVEPDLELAWWTLLRTRTAAEDYAGATVALTELEDRFGHLLIPQKLQRDRFLKTLIDQQEYKDWRAGRDAS